MRFMKVLDANLDAQILAKKPTKPGGQREDTVVEVNSQSHND